MNAYGYIRVSTSDQDLQAQEHQILSQVNLLNNSSREKVNLVETVQETVSTRKSLEKRDLEELLSRLEDKEVLIVPELSRLARSLTELLDITNRLSSKGVRLISIKEGLDIDPSGKKKLSDKITISLFSLLAEVERDMISQRTRESLANKKAQGVVLGKPKGTVQSSKYDDQRRMILNLLRLNVSILRIKEFLEQRTGKAFSYNGLAYYIRSRGLKKEAADLPPIEEEDLFKALS